MIELLAGSVVEVDPFDTPVVEVDPPSTDAIEVVVIPGPTGPRGPAGDGGLSHVQASPAASWVIEHNLGRFPAAVTVVVDGAEVSTDVLYPDIQHVTIVFSAPVSGRAEII